VSTKMQTGFAERKDAHKDGAQNPTGRARVWRLKRSMM